MKRCSCGAESYRVESKFCLKCGGNIENAPLVRPNINICTNEGCDYHKTQFIYPNEAGFCDICGSKTAFNS